jgi:hypothetical protein
MNSRNAPSIDAMWQVERLRRGDDRKPRANDTRLANGIGTIYPPDGEELAEVADRVRRRFNRHGCAGVGCADSLHVDDVTGCCTVLEALGLRQPDTKPAIAEKQCSRCRQVKAAAEFYRQRRTTDGLQGYCKACDQARSQRSEGGDAA